METEIERLQVDGVIRPVEFAEWAAPIVPDRGPSEYAATTR